MDKTWRQITQSDYTWGRDALEFAKKLLTDYDIEWRNERTFYQILNAHSYYCICGLPNGFTEILK